MEDYLTEIFAEVLQREDIFRDFLITGVGLELNGAIVIKEVTTQKTYSKQDNHATDSRPDIMIRFTAGKTSHVLFIENKLDSMEGDQQLRRYADHLKSYESDGCLTHLIYITKGHDPKDKNTIINSGTRATFYQLRWFQVYKGLEKHRSELVNILLEFMEELQLNDSRRFIPQDIYAIQNIERIIRMMDSCLDGPVEETVSSLFSRSTGWTNRFVQLKDHYRYMKQNVQGDFAVIYFGFHLTEDDYPVVSVVFKIIPKNSMRAENINALKDFISVNDGWSGEDLDDPTAMGSIYYDRSLLNFLAEPDHVSSIQEFIIARLNELYLIKKSYPEWGWK